MSKAKLQAARELLQEKRYQEARSLLQTIPSDPTAQKWLAKLDQIAPTAPQRSSKLNTQPVRSTYYPPTPPQYPPPEYSPVQYPPVYVVEQSFTGKLVFTILLLLIGIIPGIIALSIFAREAKAAQDVSGYRLPGAQELITLNRFAFVLILIFFALLLLFLISLASTPFSQSLISGWFK